MYKFFNANGRGNYVDDCVVRAISLAEGNTWDYTYNKLSNIAQSQGRMMDERYFVRKYLDDHYRRLYGITGTIGQVAMENADKVLLITTRGHITYSYYGTVIDSFDCRDRRVEDVWVVY